MKKNEFEIAEDRVKAINALIPGLDLSIGYGSSGKYTIVRRNPASGAELVDYGSGYEYTASELHHILNTARNIAQDCISRGIVDVKEPQKKKSAPRIEKDAVGISR